MKIRIRYDTSFQTVEVTEAECESMIRNDYEERRAAAADPSAVQPRTMQEILDDRFNLPEQHNYRREHRRTGPLDAFDFDGQAFIDPAAELYAGIETEELLCALREAIITLEPQQQELIRRVYFEGETLASIAAEDGVRRSSVHHRLTKIHAVLQKKLKKFAIRGETLAFPEV